MEKTKTLQRLNQVIQHRLVTSELPPEMGDMVIGKGINSYLLIHVLLFRQIFCCTYLTELRMLLLKVSCSLHTHVHVKCVTETVYFLKADGRVKFRVEHEFEVNCFNLIFFDYLEI